MAPAPRGEVSYNVQTAVDRKHHLIVEQEVTNQGLDNHQLYGMAQKAKQMLVKTNCKWWPTWLLQPGRAQALRRSGNHDLCVQTIVSKNTRVDYLAKKICL